MKHCFLSDLQQKQQQGQFYFILIIVHEYTSLNTKDIADQ